MTLELRGSARPTLQQALRWIGSRVDDIYGASIGKLEDIWMDPDSGEPLWLLVRDGRIGGRHTLVPFAQAASGAGHVWIPFEREVVRGAPAVRPSAPLSHELSDTLRRYYAESGHPVGGDARPEEPVRVSAPQPAAARHEPSPAPTAPPAMAAPAAQAAAVSPTPQRRAPSPAAAPPPRHEPPRHQPWTQARSPAPAPVEPPPLPPMPSRTPPPPRPRRPAPQQGFAAPRQHVPRPQAPLRFDAPPAPPRREPSHSDQTGARHDAARPAPEPRQASEELRLTVGEGVDMELVGRLQFRGSIVRVDPLRPGADSQG